MLIPSGEFRGEQTGRAFSASGPPGGQCGQLGQRKRRDVFDRFIGPLTQGRLPYGGHGLVRDEVPLRRRGQPAFEFAPPGNRGKLVAQRRGALFACGEIEQVQLLQHAGIPPGDEAEAFGFSRLEIYPGAVDVEGSCKQLVQKRQVQAVRQVAIVLQVPEKFFHDTALGNDDYDRL